MSFNINIDSDKYDDAVMRISCAGSLLTIIGNQFDEGCVFADCVMNEALFGVGLLIGDATKILTRK